MVVPTPSSLVMSLRAVCLPSRHELDAGYRRRGEGQGSADGSHEITAGQRRPQHGQRDTHCQSLQAGAGKTGGSSDGVHLRCNRLGGRDEHWQDGDSTANLGEAGNDVLDRIARTVQSFSYYLDITSTVKEAFNDNGSLSDSDVRSTVEWAIERLRTTQLVRSLTTRLSSGLSQTLRASG